MTTNKQVGLTFVLSLGLMTILGPIGADMYLPSLPKMAEELNTSYANIQLSLMVFVMAMGFGQLIFGPITDSLGRKRPLILGILLYFLMSLGSALSDSIGILLLCRFLQGLGASMIMVVALSMIRDVTDGIKAAQLFALLMTIEGIALVLAPSIGGFIEVLWGWRGVMYILGAMAAVALLNALVSLPESLPASKRLKLSVPNIHRTYTKIIMDKMFLLPALTLAAAFFYLFIYIGGVSHAYQHEYGLSADVFGVVLGVTGIALLMGAIISAKWVSRFGLARLAVSGTLLLLVGALLSFIAHILSWDLVFVVLGMFLAMSGIGIAEATLMSLGMLSQKTALGATAALLGSLKLVIASWASPIAGVLVEISVSYWLLFMVLFGAFVLFLGIKSAKPYANVRELAGL